MNIIERTEEESNHPLVNTSPVRTPVMSVNQQESLEAADDTDFLNQFVITQEPEKRDCEVAGYEDFQCDQTEVKNPIALVRSSIVVGKPKKYEIFRAHPAGIRWIAVHALEVVEDGREEWYLVRKDLSSSMTSIPGYQPVWLAFYITDNKKRGLWPVKGGSPTHFENVKKVIEVAASDWIYTSWEKKEKAYVAYRFEGTVPFEPSWDQYNPTIVLQEAFPERVITSMDHPAVRRFVGGTRLV